MARSSRDNDPLGILGLELTNSGTGRVGRIIGRSTEPDHVTLDDERARAIGKMLGWSESEIEGAIRAGRSYPE